MGVLSKYFFPKGNEIFVCQCTFSLEERMKENWPQIWKIKQETKSVHSSTWKRVGSNQVQCSFRHFYNSKKSDKMSLSRRMSEIKIFNSSGQHEIDLIFTLMRSEWKIFSAEELFCTKQQKFCVSSRF